MTTAQLRFDFVLLLRDLPPFLIQRLKMYKSIIRIQRYYDMINAILKTLG